MNNQIIPRNAQKILILKETACIRKPRLPTSVVHLSKKQQRHGNLGFTFQISERLERSIGNHQANKEDKYSADYITGISERLLNLSL